MMFKQIVKRISCFLIAFLLLTSMSVLPDAFSMRVSAASDLYASKESFGWPFYIIGGKMRSDTGNATMTFTNDATKAGSTFTREGNRLLIDHVGTYDVSKGIVWSDAKMVYTLPKAISGQVEISMEVWLKAGYSWTTAFEDWLVAKDSDGQSILNIAYSSNNLHMMSYSGGTSKSACAHAGCNINANNARYFNTSNCVGSYSPIKFVIDFDNGVVSFHTNNGLVTHGDPAHTYTMKLLNGGKDLKSLTFNFRGGINPAETTTNYSCATTLDEISITQLAKGQKPEATFALTNGAKDVHPKQPLRLTFSQPVVSSGLDSIYLAKQDGTKVTTKVEASYDCTDVAIVPVSTLEPLTTYTLTIPEDTVTSASSAELKADGAAITFTTGCNEDWYMEENYNRHTYPADTATLIEGTNTTTFGANSRLNLDNNQANISTRADYVEQTAKGQLDNGAGLTLRTDGRVDMIEANNKVTAETDGSGNPISVYSIGSLKLLFRINAIESGRLRTGFDLEMPGVASRGNTFLFSINNELSSGDGGSLWNIGYNNSMELVAKSNGTDEFSTFTWTTPDGEEVADEVKTFGVGRYHVDIDANLDTGIATFTVIKDNMYIGKCTTTAAVKDPTYSACTQLVFSENFAEGLDGISDVYNVEENGKKKLHYIIDNIYARGGANVGVSLLNAGSAVGLSDSLVLDFVTPVTESEVSDKVTLWDKNGSSVSYKGSLSADGYTYTITPDAELAYTNSVYTIEVAEMTDWAGVKIPAKSLTFTTVLGGPEVKISRAALTLQGQTEPLSSLPAGKTVVATVTYENSGESTAQDAILCVAVYKADGTLIKLAAAESNIAAKNEKLYTSAETFADLNIVNGKMTSDTGNATMTFTNDVASGASTFTATTDGLVVNHKASYDAGTSTMTDSAAKMVYTLPEAVNGKVEVSFSIDMAAGYEGWISDNLAGMIIPRDSKGNKIFDIDFHNNILYLNGYGQQGDASKCTACNTDVGAGRHFYGSSSGAAKNIKFVLDFDNEVVSFYQDGNLGMHNGHVYTMKLQNNAEDLKYLDFNFRGGRVATSGTVNDSTIKLNNIAITQTAKSAGINGGATISTRFITPEDLGTGGYVTCSAWDRYMQPLVTTVVLGK